MQKLLIPFICCCFSSYALAWGGRGHHTICDAATYLVKNPELKEFLTQRPQVMGHLCNVPDIYWKTLGEDLTSIGNPTHFIKPSLIGLEKGQAPSDYGILIKSQTAKPDDRIKNLPKELGSLWWRAQQFYKRGLEGGRQAASSLSPADKKEEQDEKLPYNQGVFDFFVNLGIMGHFVGDASMPYHSSTNYDGFDNGHGGIHGYYEDLVLEAEDVDLIVKVRDEGLRLQKLNPSFLQASSIFLSLQDVSFLSHDEIKEIEAMDPVLKYSSVQKVDGQEKKTPAERKSASEIAMKMKPLIVAELGRSAVVLAKFWDQAYVEAGKPKLTKYRSFRYPMMPEFVKPDYY